MALTFLVFFFFFKQKTAYEMRISDWSSDVCSSDLPQSVAMEACASSHHWGRVFEALSYAVRLIHPRFVKPFVKGSKNDAVDAEAIFEAANRPTMRFVPLKSVEQQDLQALHRTRDRLIVQRTALINHTRGLRSEEHTSELTSL